MAFAFPNFVDLLFYLYLYWWGIIPLAVGAFIATVTRILAFPLLTRNSCELVIIIGPDKAKVLRVTKHLSPFFTTKEGAYWYGEPKTLTMEGKVVQLKSRDKMLGEKKIYPRYSQNKIHIYAEGINQPLYDVKRNEKKVGDLQLHSVNKVKQARKHAVQIPPSALSFHKHWALIWSESKETCELRAVKEKQPYGMSFGARFGIGATLGFYVTAQKEAQGTTGNAELQAITVQTVLQKVGDIEQNANYSASYALFIVKFIQYMEKRWVGRLLGAIDARILLLLVGAAAAIAAIFLLSPPSGNIEDILGPMPTG